MLPGLDSRGIEGVVERDMVTKLGGLETGLPLPSDIVGGW
jgi:hypothetical protein